MIKRKIILSIVLLCSTLSISAQLLWEISGKGLKQTSYLFATNKLCPIAFLDSVPELFKIFNNSPVVITEMALNSLEMQLALRKASLLPDSISLHDFYNAVEYSEINSALLTTLKMDLSKLGRMKPAYLTELYRTELYRVWLNYDENLSSEIFFQSIAAEQGKKIIGLDDLAESIYMLFDREPLEWQTQELLKTIQYPEREIKQEKMLLTLYKNGLLNDMAYQVMMPDNQSSVSYSDYQLFALRNQQWAKQIPLYIAQESSFIVLDAIYLGGEKGLINQLKQMGYKVRAVNR